MVRQNRQPNAIVAARVKSRETKNARFPSARSNRGTALFARFFNLVFPACDLCLIRRRTVARTVLREGWGRLNFERLARALKAAFAAINAMTTELYYQVTVMQAVVPANGGTTVCTDAVNDGHVVCTPAATIASHTFTFPSNANSRIGQKLTISTSAEITAVTFSGSGLTITEDVTGLAAGAAITFQKVAASTWRRIG
jgi:hypothetical protein